MTQSVVFCMTFYVVDDSADSATTPPIGSANPFVLVVWGFEFRFINLVKSAPPRSVVEPDPDFASLVKVTPNSHRGRQLGRPVGVPFPGSQDPGFALR